MSSSLTMARAFGAVYPESVFCDEHGYSVLDQLEWEQRKELGVEDHFIGVMEWDYDERLFVLYVRDSHQDLEDHYHQSKGTASVLVESGWYDQLAAAIRKLGLPPKHGHWITWCCWG